jgi:hypothetical protein
LTFLRPRPPPETAVSRTCHARNGKKNGKEGGTPHGVCPPPRGGANAPRVPVRVSLARETFTQPLPRSTLVLLRLQLTTRPGQTAGYPPRSPLLVLRSVPQRRAA